MPAAAPAFLAALFYLQPSAGQGIPPGRWNILPVRRGRCVRLRGPARKPPIFVYATPTRWRDVARILDSPALPHSVPIALCPLPQRTSLAPSLVSLAVLQERGLDLRTLRQAMQALARRPRGHWPGKRYREQNPGILSRALNSRRLLAQLAENTWEALRIGLDPWSGDIGLRHGSTTVVVETGGLGFPRRLFARLSRGARRRGLGRTAVERMARWPADHRYMAHVLLGRPGLLRRQHPPGVLLLQRGRVGAVQVHYVLPKLPIAPWLLRPLEEMPPSMRPHISVTVSFGRPPNHKARLGLLRWTTRLLSRGRPPGPKALARRPPSRGPVAPRARRLLETQWRWTAGLGGPSRPRVLVDGIPLPNPAANLSVYLILSLRANRGLLSRYLNPPPWE